MPHVALLDPEIIANIAKEIPNHTQTTLPGGTVVKPNTYNDFVQKIDAASYKTLAGFALVSKAWKEPALNALWREIPDFVPLGKLFPEGTFVIKRGAAVPGPNRDPWYDTARSATVRAVFSW